MKKTLAAAAASQKQEMTGAGLASPQNKDPIAHKSKSYTASDIWAWYARVKNRKDKHGKPQIKKSQMDMLKIICQRLCTELEEGEKCTSDPLFWLMHGGPGTGKSEVLKLVKELFRDVCGWNIGLDYQIAALQAVTAQLLEGDTIHHALGINPFGAKTDAKAQDKASRRQADVAQQIMQWRWLFIDEVSMVSARLLAEIDMKLRTIVSNVGSMKKDMKGNTRPFGGINIIFSGDFWQLDPPRGGFIADIPAEFLRRARMYDPKPDAAHGQSIFWHLGAGCIQGITELTECVRTEDPWLLEVQTEMRNGSLSEDNWNFLHGRATTVPGSWVNGKVTCGNSKCCASWKSKSVECAICEEERRSKHRVMNDKNEERHLKDDFLRAPAIFPNNDIKYDVNKQRARIFAAETKQAITWSIARDMPSNKVISRTC